MSGSNPAPTSESVSLPLSVAHTWIDTDVEELEYELPSGKMATDLKVTETGLRFGASEQFGENGVPYADTPETHREYVESPDVASTEGAVTYPAVGVAEQDLDLPARIWFSEEVPFKGAGELTTIDQLVEAMETALAEAVEKDVTVEPPEELQ